MNADLKAMMAADLAYAISEIPYSCTFGAVAFSATPGDLRRMNEVAPEGILYEHDLEIHAAVSAFSTLPDVQEIITVDGVRYHVVMRSVDAAKVGVTFGLRCI
jgi:hypothetical protein